MHTRSHTDGFSDLEAMQGSEDGADAFICYGGVMQRPEVASQADWFVRSYDELMSKLKRYKVCLCVRACVCVRTCRRVWLLGCVQSYEWVWVWM